MSFSFEAKLLLPSLQENPQGSTILLQVLRDKGQVE